MKLAVLLLLIGSACSAQTITAKQAGKLSKEIAQCIRKNALFKDSLDIDGLEADVKAHIDTFDTYKKVGLYYTRALRKAGDSHSFYVRQEDIDNYSKKQKENIAFNYQLLDGHIGYLQVPGFLSTDQRVINDFADQIQDAIGKLDSSATITGWIVDLRNNDGGNMWPMLSGLSPLINSDVAGYFSTPGKKELAPWKTSSPFNGVARSKNYLLKDRNSRVAVLYGPRTASSGEATAISFIGRPNTRSFGERTAGLTTANGIFYLSDGNIFVLASTCEMDRNKNLYMGKLEPDELLENRSADEVLNRAKQWLSE